MSLTRALKQLVMGRCTKSKRLRLPTGNNSLNGEIQSGYANQGHRIGEGQTEQQLVKQKETVGCIDCDIAE